MKQYREIYERIKDLKSSMRISHNSKELAHTISNISEYYEEIENFLIVDNEEYGTTKTISEFVPIKNIYSIQPIPIVNKESLEPTEFVGKSVSSLCTFKLNEWDKKFDVILIDDPISFVNSRRIFEMVLPYTHEGTIVLFHKTTTDYRIKDFCESLKLYRFFSFLITINDDSREEPEQGITIFIKKKNERMLNSEELKDFVKELMGDDADDELLKYIKGVNNNINFSLRDGDLYILMGTQVDVKYSYIRIKNKDRIVIHEGEINLINGFTYWYNIDRSYLDGFYIELSKDDGDIYFEEFYEIVNNQVV